MLTPALPEADLQSRQNDMIFRTQLLVIEIRGAGYAIPEHTFARNGLMIMAWFKWKYVRGLGNGLIVLFAPDIFEHTAVL